MSVSKIPEKSPINQERQLDLPPVAFSKKENSLWGVGKSADLARKSRHCSKVAATFKDTSFRSIVVGEALMRVYDAADKLKDSQWPIHDSTTNL